MKGDASKKQTSLLHALDQSFSYSDVPAGPSKLRALAPTTRQNAIDHYFEAGSSNAGGIEF